VIFCPLQDLVGTIHCLLPNEDIIDNN